MSPPRLFPYRRTVKLLGIATCLAASSCFSTVVKSGAPAAGAPIEYDEKWHSGLVFGLAELSGPYDLSRICPNGWAEIKTETSFVNGFVQLVTWNIYNPQTVTVRCAAGAPPPNVSGSAPSLAGSPPPATPPTMAAPSSPPPSPAPVAPPPSH
ncbi:MAG TPA: hypothetical protein VK550_35255 [Polyangiaceae bacterium]|nr:hypothetical protein [Polyangiaceae bacterium]